MSIANGRFGFSLVEGLILVLIIGILATMAVPAFHQVKLQEQKRKILVNLEYIATIGQEYMNAEKVDKVTYEDLIANKYLQAIRPINGENYAHLIIYKNKGALEVEMGQQRVVYEYGS